MARSGLPRWFWPLLAALCALLLLLQVLLQHSSNGDAGEGLSGPGARSRAPFPKGGEFSEVRRKPEVGRREKSAADPWQEGRKQK